MWRPVRAEAIAGSHRYNLPVDKGISHKQKKFAMPRLRSFLIWGAALLLVLLIGLVLFFVFFDWNLLKPTLNAKLSEALQRPFAIEGNLDVTWRREPEESAWLPLPHVSAEKLVVGNPPWAADKRFVSLEKVEFLFSPLPLLGRRVRIPRIQLTGPAASLQRLADGRSNWTFDLGQQEPDEAPSPWRLDIGTIGFDKGMVKLDDRILNSRGELVVEPLGKPIPFEQIVGKQPSSQPADASSQPQDYAFAWTVKGTYRGVPIDGGGKVGGLLALQDAALPFPVQADIAAGAARIALSGTLTDPQHLGALDLRLRLSGDSLGNLYPLTGVILPDTPPYGTDGRLTARLHDPAGVAFHYRDFNGRIGGSDIHGNLGFVASQPRAKLSGELVSNQLLFADLAPLIGADSNAGKQARGAAVKQPADKVLPVEAFETDRWRGMDADVRFTGKRIVHSDRLPINDLSTHVRLDDGVLALQPLRFGVAGGTLDASVRLDGSRAPLQGKAELRARDFKLKQLFLTFAPMRTSLGELNGDATLSGSGNSVATLLGSADGEVKLLLNDGAVSRGLMEIAGLNVGNYLVGKLFGDNEVRINCAAADMGIKQGVMATRLFVVDTENAVIKVDGTTDFRRERLDMTITPASKGVRLLSLRSPLYVRGTFKAPSAGVKAGPLALRGAGLLALGVAVAPAAGLLALVAPSGGEQANQCEPLLQEMQSLKP
jgi:uncharacterized protein involved in outer membrane biogenesis